MFGRSIRGMLRGAIVPTLAGQVMEAEAIAAPRIPDVRRPEFLARAWSPQEFYTIWNGVLTDALYQGRIFLISAERGEKETEQRAVDNLMKSSRNAAAIYGAYFGREQGQRFGRLLEGWHTAGLDYARTSLGDDDEGRRSASESLVGVKDELVQAFSEAFEGYEWSPDVYSLHLQGAIDHTRWAIDARKRQDWKADMIQMGHILSNKESLATALTYHFSKKYNPRGEAIPSDLAAFNLGAWATTMAIQGNAGLLMMKEGGNGNGLGIAEIETGLALLWGNTMWNSRLVGLAVEEEDEQALRDLLEVRGEIRQQWRSFLGPFCDSKDIEAYHKVSEDSDRHWLELVRESRRQPADLTKHTYTNQMLELEQPIVDSTINLYKRWMTPRAMLNKAIEPAVNLMLMAQGMAIDVRSALVREPGSMPPKRL